MARKILILRKSSLGDIIHTMPAYHALRDGHRDAEIHWAVSRGGLKLLERVEGIDRIWEFNRRFLRHVRSEKFDIIVDFQGLLQTAAASWLAGGGRRFGFSRGYTRERFCQLFYTDPVRPSGTHVIEINLSLARAAGGAPMERPFCFGSLVSEMEQTRVDRELEKMGIKPGFVLLNPGAAWKNKRWSPRKFGAVARRLSSRQVVVAFGPGEREMAEEVVRASDGAAVLCFETSFLEFGALALRSALVITGDTGPMHMASAVGVRVLGLFAPTSPYRNGPWNPGDRWIIADARCDFCYRRSCPWSDCIDTIDVDQVAEAAGEILTC